MSKAQVDAIASLAALGEDQMWALLAATDPAAFLLSVRDRIAALEVVNAMLRDALRDALETWTFSDSSQAHTHTWHDREDWKERHREVIDSALRGEGGGDAE